MTYSGWEVIQDWRQNGAGFEAFKLKLRGRLESLGPLAPVGFILIQALQVVVAPIPGEATGFLGGVPVWHRARLLVFHRRTHPGLQPGF